MDTPAEPQPKRLLVLAASGAFGGGFREPGARLWPETVRDGLITIFGEVEMTLQRFYVHGGDPWTRLERSLDAVQPDFIVLQCTSWPATQKTVANRVSRVLGRTAGDWTEARVLAIDRRARRKGPVRHRLNHAGRLVARKVIGTAPLIGVRPLVDRYVRVIDRVAMVESAAIAIIGTGYPSAAARRNNRKVDDIKQQFDGAIATAARRKHLGWVDSAAITLEAADPEATFLDPLHKGPQWHDGLAAGVLAALLPERELAAARAYQSSQS